MARISCWPEIKLDTYDVRLLKYIAKLDLAKIKYEITRMANDYWINVLGMKEVPDLEMHVDATIGDFVAILFEYSELKVPPASIANPETQKAVLEMLRTGNATSDLLTVVQEQYPKELFCLARSTKQ